MNGASYEVKASLLRSYIHQLQQRGLWDKVKARVSPATLKHLDDPPLASTWIDGLVIEELIEALHAVGGVEAVKEVTKQGQQIGLLAVVKPVVIGLLRLFGATPPTLLSRFGDMSRSSLRGPVEFEWIADGLRSGRFRIHFVGRRNMPRSAFIGFQTAIQIVCELCGVAGTIAEAELNGSGNGAVFHVSW